jgi:hypothetical protein
MDAFAPPRALESGEWVLFRQNLALARQPKCLDLAKPLI